MQDKNNRSEKKRLQQLLASTFGELPFPFKDVAPNNLPAVNALKGIFANSCSRNERADKHPRNIERIYFDLGLFDPIQFRYALPRLLYDLLDYDQNEIRYTILVIGYLNVLMPITQSHIPNRQMQFKEDKFSLFTGAQVEAILEWLLFARSWGELEDFLEEVNSAIGYWQQVLTSHSRG